VVLDILKAMSKTLNQVFGDGHEVYFSADVKQGLREPCFFISLLTSSRIRRIDLRYYQQNSFDVQYFPAGGNPNVEMVEVAGQLTEAFEYLELLDGDLVRGTGMNYQIVDGVLHFLVDFNIFLKKDVESDEMETLILESSTSQ